LTSFVQPRIQSDRSIGLIERYFFRAGKGPITYPLQQGKETR